MKSSFVVFSLLLTACVEPAPEAPAGEKPQGWTLSVEPDTPLDACESVATFHLWASGKDDPLLPKDVVLVEGKPSQVSIGKYEEGETTESLAEKLVSLRSYEEKNHVEFRPLGVLALGQTYTVLSRSGVLGTIVVAPTVDRNYLKRFWPPPDSSYRVHQALYCGTKAPNSKERFKLFPTEFLGSFSVGIGDSENFEENCVRLIPESKTKGEFLPPTNLGEFSFEPTLFINSQELGEMLPAECGTDETAFGPGCIKMDGNRALLRGPRKMTFWAIFSTSGMHFQVIDGDGRFVIPEISGLKNLEISATVFDLTGRSTDAKTIIQLPPPAPRPVINEVLSNPLGAEPAEEWIEIVNAGDADAVLTNYVLSDGGGSVTLPNLTIAPGAFALLVREDFVGGISGDIAPESHVAIVRLPQLGKSGLSNSGEALTLTDVDGKLVSSFPARAAERAGVSVARRDPTTLDDDSSGFLAHAPPGASPGAPNAVE
jgi:hypothetical protein